MMPLLLSSCSLFLLLFLFLLLGLCSTWAIFFASCYFYFLANLTRFISYFVVVSIAFYCCLCCCCFWFIAQHFFLHFFAFFFLLFFIVYCSSAPTRQLFSPLSSPVSLLLFLTLFHFICLCWFSMLSSHSRPSAVLFTSTCSLRSSLFTLLRSLHLPVSLLLSLAFAHTRVWVCVRSIKLQLRTATSCALRFDLIPLFVSLINLALSLFLFAAVERIQRASMDFSRLPCKTIIIRWAKKINNLKMMKMNMKRKTNVTVKRLTLQLQLKPFEWKTRASTF